MEIVKNEDLGKKPTREPFLSQGPVPKLNPRSHGIWIAGTPFGWDFSRTTAGSGQECLEPWVHSPRFLERQRGDVPPLAHVDWVPAAGRKAHRCAWPTSGSTYCLAEGKS